MSNAQRKARKRSGEKFVKAQKTPTRPWWAQGTMYDPLLMSSAEYITRHVWNAKR